jgi:hypothetical protein
MAVAFKLGTLFLRTISKPLAVRIRATAQHHPEFQAWCIRCAQVTHRLDQMLSIRLMGHQVVNIKPLSEGRTSRNYLVLVIALVYVAGIPILVIAVFHSRWLRLGLQRGQFNWGMSLLERL